MNITKTAAVLSLTAAAFALGHANGIAANPSQQELDAKAMEAAWDAMGQTGRMHKLIEPFVGEWKAEAVFYMPDGEMKSTGKMVNKWIMDGKILEQSYVGDMMGEEFRGYGLWGYSAAAETFQTLWCDSMTTHMDFNTEMVVSDDGKTFTSDGDQFVAPGMKMAYQDVVQIVSENEHTFTRSLKMPGGLEKSMEITYTR